MATDHQNIDYRDTRDTGYRDDVIETTAVSMPVRIYGQGAARPSPLVLHLHGGAFVGGSLETGHTVSALLAQAGAVVISADYPLAPKHPFPQALQAAFSVLGRVHGERARWAGKKSSLFVAGEEAGGNLAASLALMSRDQLAAPLAGQILLSPMVDPCMATRSIRQAEAGPVGCRWADGWHEYLGSADKAAHPYAAPLGSSRLGGVAPALVLTAEDDPMRDEALSYAKRLRQAGVAADELVLAAPTGWPCTLLQPATAAAAWTRIVRDRIAAFFANPPALFASATPLHPSLT